VETDNRDKTDNQEYAIWQIKNTNLCIEEKNMRYGLSKLFKRGITIGMLPTYKCNLDCEYCSNKFGRAGNKFDSLEITPDDWYRLLSSFPVKIRELHITGGEPFIYKEIEDLILKMLSLGFHVSLNSNLLIKKNLSMVKSDRFRIEATLHDLKHTVKFHSNVAYYRQWVRVDIDIFGDTKLKGNKRDKDGVAIKAKMGENEAYVCLDMKRFKFTPDGRLWTNDREIGDTYSLLE